MARRPINCGSLPGWGLTSVSDEANGDVDQSADLDLVGTTIALWQPRASRELSREDARQIVENVVGFFAILAEWSQAETLVPANDTVEPAETSSSDELRNDR
jgi:hypothetical protein